MGEICNTDLRNVQHSPGCGRAPPARAAEKRPSMSPLQVRLGHSGMSDQCPDYPGEFNRSVQHLLILLDEEVADGDVTDIVHGEAEGRTLGALEERTKCVSHLPGAGKEEQDRRPADRGSQWRDRSGAASQSCGGVEA